METMRKAPRLTANEGDDDEGVETLMDADVWGQLQEYLPLHTIYEKLSQRDLFRLRPVNKEWNHAALQWTLPQPSFVTIVEGHDRNHLLNGIVAYNCASGKFKFHQQRLRLCHFRTHVMPFEVEGLILCHSSNDLEKRGVYNVHNQTWHAIPAGPEQRSETLSACGLLVDTSVRPYTFKLVEGNQNFRTQIYDSKSRSWSRTSSYLSSSIKKLSLELTSTVYCCICHNGNAYMCVGRHTILKYSLEDDKWTELKFPKVTFGVYEFPWDETPQENTLGVWGGRIFTTAEDHEKQRVSVWELVDSEGGQGQEWVEYACMPEEQYEWLWKHEFDDEETCMRSFFCEGYMLVCAWWWKFNCADVFALFNIATKVWRNVDMPRGSVAVGAQRIERSHGNQDLEEEEDEGFDEADHVCECGVPIFLHEYDEYEDEDEDIDEEDDFDEDEDIDEEDEFDEDDGVDD